MEQDPALDSLASWRRFASGALPRVGVLDPATFALEHWRRGPVIARGAYGGRALERWDTDHLCALAGDARLTMYAGAYELEAKGEGYANLREVHTTLAEHLRRLERGETDHGYLFGHESGLFATQRSDPDLAHGWVQSPNAGLAPLADEFAMPDFVPRRDWLWSALLAGAPRHRVPLHYDLGGEAKVLVQIRGRKHVLFFPPTEAFRMHFPTWIETERDPVRQPNDADVRLDEPDFARYPELADLRGREAILEPGDALYWPAFWPHVVHNLDPVTLAVAVATEELRTDALALREVLGLFGRMLKQRIVAGETYGLSSPEPLVAALRAVEAELTGPGNAARRSFWNWQHAVPR